MTVIDDYVSLLAASKAGRLLSLTNRSKAERVATPPFLPAPVFDFGDVLKESPHILQDLLGESLFRLALGTFVVPYPVCYYAYNGSEGRMISRVRWAQNILHVDAAWFDERYHRWWHTGAWAELSGDILKSFDYTRVHFLHQKSMQMREYYSHHAIHYMDNAAILTAMLSVPEVHFDSISAAPSSKLMQRKAGVNAKRSLPLFKRVVLPADFHYTAPSRHDHRLSDETERTVQAHTRRAHLRHLPPDIETPVGIADIHGGDPFLRHYKVSTRESRGSAESLVPPVEPVDHPPADDVQTTIQALETLASTASPPVAAELREVIARLEKIGQASEK